MFERRGVNKKGRLCKGDPNQGKTYQDQFTPGEQLNQLWAWWENETDPIGCTERSGRIFNALWDLKGRQKKQ